MVVFYEIPRNDNRFTITNESDDITLTTMSCAMLIFSNDAPAVARIVFLVVAKKISQIYFTYYCITKRSSEVYAFSVHSLYLYRSLLNVQKPSDSSDCAVVYEYECSHSIRTTFWLIIIYLPLFVRLIVDRVHEQYTDKTKIITIHTIHFYTAAVGLLSCITFCFFVFFFFNHKKLTSN